MEEEVLVSFPAQRHGLPHPLPVTECQSHTGGAGTEPDSHMGTRQTSSLRPRLGSRARAVCDGTGKGCMRQVRFWSVSGTFCSKRKCTTHVNSAARLSWTQAQFAP